MDIKNNIEALCFETTFITRVPVLDYNNGKSIHDLGIFPSKLDDENLPHSMRQYSYLPLFVPGGKEGKFDITSYPKLGAPNEKIVEIKIILETDRFRNAACEAIKKRFNTEEGIDALTIENIKVRPLYNVEVIEFSVQGDTNFMALQAPAHGINRYSSTDRNSEISVRLIAKSEDAVKELLENAHQIRITFRFDMHNIATDTNSLTIKVSEFTDTENFRDLKGKAEGKFVERGNVGKLISSLASSIKVTENIEKADANTAAHQLTEKMMDRLHAKADEFAEKAYQFCEEKGYSEKDILPDVVTGEISESKDQWKTRTSTERSEKGGLLAGLFGVVRGVLGIKSEKSEKYEKYEKTEKTEKTEKSEQPEHSSSSKTENERENLQERKHEWVGEKYNPKHLVLLTDVLTAFEQNHDLNFVTNYRTKTSATFDTTISFADFDYTPKPEPKPEPKPQPKLPKTMTENCGDKNLGLELVLVEGGKFQMGGQDNEVQENEKPVHEVELSTFYMSKYPITQKQWKAIKGDNPSYFGGRDNHPVEQIDWNDANGFCDQLNRNLGYDSNAPTGKFRLPTEAEWEYAARGGRHSQNHKYAGGGGLSDVAWYGNSNGSTHPVGEKRGNELGIHDLSGNVWEWCSDEYCNYSYAPQTNPTGPPPPSIGGAKVLRGGAWITDALYCRVASRFNSAPAIRYYSIGFRVFFVP